MDAKQTSKFIGCFKPINIWTQGIRYILVGLTTNQIGIPWGVTSSQFFLSFNKFLPLIEFVQCSMYFSKAQQQKENNENKPF